MRQKEGDMKVYKPEFKQIVSGFCMIIDGFVKIITLGSVRLGISYWWTKRQY